jgi:glucosylglycerol-phosphate synthase
MLLATDLDGTFLAGSPEARHTLYQLIARNPEIKLAYVTGRGLESVLPLLFDPSLPDPDYIICDVGATVVTGTSLLPIQPLQGEIGQRWPGEQKVAAAFADQDRLVRQNTPQERRCSFFCESNAVTPEIAAIAKSLDCEILFSADRYLDVLPKGVNKGSTLRALVNHLGLDEDKVLVAGDTMNDLSMYQHGFKGVCVGCSEIGLTDATCGLTHVFHAEREGCGGIIDAIEHFNLLDHLDVVEPSEIPPGASDLVMVYHRLPYDEFIEDGELKRRRPSSPNGIIPTLLSYFRDGRRGSWVAWSTHDDKRRHFQARTPVDIERYPNLVCARVPMTKHDVDIFYKRFSKEAFWPMLHTFWERARFREDHWQVFLRVNRTFAEAAAAEAAPGAVVWIHDYNLWMVPGYLRELRPDVKIAFFHHTHFPSADVFNVVPWRRQIVGSLLQCDYVGFHIPRQVENFVDVVRGVTPMKILAREHCAPRFLTYGCAVGIDQVTTSIEVNGRNVRLGAHPVGLDVDRIEEILARPVVQRQIRDLRDDLKDVRLILSVERLDYTKGTLEKLVAFERLLEQHPELQGKVTLIAICVPASQEMKVYRDLQSQIEGAVGSINGRYSKVGWTPVQFFFRAVPFEQLVAYYAVADLMWDTPLRDGLNLVAKEYVAAQGLTGTTGVLVLSEFAGVGAELKGAVLTNPHDVNDLVTSCHQGLMMSENERQGRMHMMYEIVRHNDIRRWGNDFLAAVRGEPDTATAEAAQRRAS